MKEFRRRLDILDQYEPVQYDKRIVKIYDDYFLAGIVRDNVSANVSSFSTLERAQEALDKYPPDVYEGYDVPWSVFYPGR